MVFCFFLISERARKSEFQGVNKVRNGVSVNKFKERRKECGFILKVVFFYHAVKIFFRAKFYHMRLFRCSFFSVHFFRVKWLF